ncbi:MAG TPA: aldehyde dehydrogenase family protein [Nocardioides sp.]|nr:aldehyde dehydrogenase family protein [Nocardioides sp.]
MSRPPDDSEAGPDPEPVVVISAAALDGSGPVGNTARRFVVLEHLYDGFVGRLSAALLEAADGLPPLASESAATALEAQVVHAVAEGATYTSMGERHGAWFPPGLLTGVEPHHAAFGEELLGPIAIVVPAADEEHAADLAHRWQDALRSRPRQAPEPEADQGRRLSRRP